MWADEIIEDALRSCPGIEHQRQVRINPLRGSVCFSSLLVFLGTLLVRWQFVLIDHFLRATDPLKGRVCDSCLCSHYPAPFIFSS